MSDNKHKTEKNQKGEVAGEEKKTCSTCFLLLTILLFRLFSLLLPFPLLSSPIPLSSSPLFPDRRLTNNTWKTTSLTLATLLPHNHDKTREVVAAVGAVEGAQGRLVQVSLGWILTSLLLFLPSDFLRTPLRLLSSLPITLLPLA